MEPASAAVGVVSGAVALAAFAYQTAKFLVDIKDVWKNTTPSVSDLVSLCHAYRAAWLRIHQWAEQHITAKGGAESVFEHLEVHLESGNVVLSDVQGHFERLNLQHKNMWPLGRRTKVRAMLHQNAIHRHCDRISRQMVSLHLLLSAAQL